MSGLVEATALFLSGKFSQALKAYSKALESKLPDATASIVLCNRASAALELSMSKACLEDAKKALTADPSNLRAIILVGKAQAALGKSEQALQTWKSGAAVFGDVQLHRELQVLIDEHTGFLAAAKCARLIVRVPQSYMCRSSNSAGVAASANPNSTVQPSPQAANASVESSSAPSTPAKTPSESALKSALSASRGDEKEQKRGLIFSSCCDQQVQKAVLKPQNRRLCACRHRFARMASLIMRSPMLKPCS